MPHRKFEKWFHFFFVEQSQLFVLSPDCIAPYLEQPAVLSCLVGDFLQQLYHYRCVGPLILALSLMLTGFVIYKALTMAGRFRKGWKAALCFAAALVAMTLEARLFLYENAHLSSLLSLLGGCSMWMACDSIKGKWSRFVTLPLGGALCYILFGYGLLAMLLMELCAAALRRRVPYEGAVAVAIFAMAFVPVRKAYRLEAKVALLYPGAGLWVDYTKSRGVEDLLYYDVEYYAGNYLQLVHNFETSKNPKTKEMTFFYALGAAHLGQLPDKLPKMKKPMLGTFSHVDETSPLFFIRMMGELYYAVGDMTYSERFFMHANSFTPGKRSARLIQRLVEINLITENYDVAQKYCGMLAKSVVYKKWAKDHDPSSMSPEVLAEVERKRQYINTIDEIHIGENGYSILTGLLDSNKDNIMALDYLLCSDIVAGQKAMYYKDYEKYGPRDKSLYRRVMR